MANNFFLTQSKPPGEYFLFVDFAIRFKSFFL